VHAMIVFLRVASIFGVLPCSKGGLSKTSISSGAILVIQIIAYLFYIVYFCQTFKQFYDTGFLEPTRTRIAKVTALVNYSIDIFNVCAIIAFSRRVPQLTQTFLRICARGDKILQFNDSPWTSVRMYFFTLFTAAEAIAKNSFLIFSMNSNSLSARYVSVLIVFCEQYISYVSLEIKSRLKHLNAKLKTRNAPTQKDVESLLSIFRELTGFQTRLAKYVSKILLFDLAQLLMLIIFRSLNAIWSCVFTEVGSTRGISWCVTNLVFTCDGLWRFSMIAWSCGSVQAEV
jgi:hypothetical protein